MDDYRSRMDPTMLFAAIDDIINPQSSRRSRAIGLRRKWRGILFSIIIAAIPILIVVLSPPRTGGIFVAGYLIGAITAPIVAILALKAADDLFESGWRDSLLGTVIYVFAIILVSAAAVAWSLYFAH
jgi:hypothetical protein